MTPSEFLESRCFYCQRMRARITPDCCHRRQHAEVKHMEVLKKQIPDDLGVNNYCALRKCEQGRRYR